MQYKQRFQIDGYWLSKRNNSQQWCATWYCKKTRQTRRISLSTTNFELAKKELAHYVVLNAEIKKSDREELPLATVFSRYYDRHAKSIRSKSFAKQALNIWLDYWQASNVSELTRLKQDSFIDYLKSQSFSPGYIRRIITVGKAALNHCVEYGELTHCPKIIMPKEPGGKRTERLSTQQAAQLFATSKQKSLIHIADFLMLAFNTAARPEAILELTYSQIDLKRGRIDFNQSGRVQTKKYRPIVPITETLSEWLKNRSFAPDQTVITYNGKSIKSIKKAFRGVRDTAKLPDWVCPYSIRHTVAQHLRDEGVAFENIQGLLGHSIKGCTSIYANFNPDKQEGIVSTLDGFMDEILIRA